MLLNVPYKVKYAVCAENEHLSVRTSAVCELLLASKTLFRISYGINEFLPCYPHLLSDLDAIKYKISENNYVP